MKKFSVLIVVLLVCSVLFSSPLSETVGAQGTTNPHSSRMFAQGAETAYFNPALLTLVKRSFSFNFFYSYQNLDISLMDRDSGLDIVGSVDDGTGVYGADRDDKLQGETNLPFKPRPTSDLDERGGKSTKSGEMYGALGLAFPLIEEYLSIGFYGVIPIGNLMKQDSFFPDERESNFSNSLHYELYDDRMSAFNLSLALSGGYKWVYAGVGVSASAQADINTTVYTPDAGKNENKIHADTTIKARFTPHFGLVIKPLASTEFNFLQLGISVHLPTKTTVDTVNKITFWNINREQEAEINTNVLDVTYAYKPLTLSPSIAITDLKVKEDLLLNLGFTAIWRKWSDYVNRYTERPEDNYYWDPSIESESENRSVSTKGGWAYESLDEYKWKDTWEFILGAAVEHKSIKAGLDLGYFMSPVPDQKGRTNYVDNNRINLAAGFSYTWDIKSFQLETGINFQSLIMIKRETVKDEGVPDSVGKGGTVVDEFPESSCDGFSTECGEPGEKIVESVGFQTNNPGYPGFTSSGQIFSGGIWFKLYF
jgi:long-chain fatty acid transport protein